MGSALSSVSSVASRNGIISDMERRVVSSIQKWRRRRRRPSCRGTERKDSVDASLEEKRRRRLYNKMYRLFFIHL
ncbi:hypothetical protein GW17_00059372 [Ensete ventricosum]|nr:hypothetical protein GW17_00059372 [Ensete ventricosum]